MSKSVSDALEFIGDKDTEETAKFIKMIDKFFDTLNVTNLISGKHKKKPFQSLYIPSKDGSKDFRLKVIQI